MPTNRGWVRVRNFQMLMLLNNCTRCKCSKNITCTRCKCSRNITQTTVVTTARKSSTSSTTATSRDWTDMRVMPTKASAEPDEGGSVLT